MKKRYYLITTPTTSELFFGTSKKAFKRSAEIGGLTIRKISNKRELRELKEELEVA